MPTKAENSAVQHALDRYQPGTRVADKWKAGGRSFVYKLTNKPKDGVFHAKHKRIPLEHDADWGLLRVQCTATADSLDELEMQARNVQSALDRAYRAGIGPCCEVIGSSFHKDISYIVMIMERVTNVINPVNWLKAFKGDKGRLLRLLFLGGRMLERSHVLHPDVTINNVLLKPITGTGEIGIWFIDFDKACRPGSSMEDEFCRMPGVYTEGYRPKVATTKRFFQTTPYAMRKVMMFSLLTTAAYGVDESPFDAEDTADRMPGGVEAFVRRRFHEAKYKTFVNNVLDLKYNTFSEALRDLPD